MLSLVSGTAGFLRCDPAAGFATAFYRAVQLFYWNYFPWNATLEAKLPWSLEIARWLAPIVTLGALSRVAIALFHKRWDHFRAKRMRGHAVICGAGLQGMVLARELRGSGSQVIIIESNSDRVEALAAEGELAVHGDATKPEILRGGSVQRAALVIAATGNDHDNIAVAMSAVQSGAGTIFAHSSSSALSDLYWRNRVLASSLNGAGRVRLFNHARNVARCTILDFPPGSDRGQAHVVLPDLGALATALAVEYALVGHFKGDRKIHLHIVGRNASGELVDFLARFPGIHRCAQISAVDLAPSQSFSRATADLATNPADSFTIYPDLADEGRACSLALEIRESIPSDFMIKVLIPGSGDSSMRPLIEENPDLRGRIGFLPPPERTCGYEAVVGGSLDRVACAIHENWLIETRHQIAEARARGDESLAKRHEAKGTFRPWEDLSEEQKGANRSQADHIPCKIRAAGFDPKTVTKADWDQLTGETIEFLARMEHERWAAYYWMTGWTCAAERNEERKAHPNLVPYDDLDEPTKDYDRKAVRNLGQYLVPGKMPDATSPVR